MSAGEIHVGDIGTALEFEVKDGSVVVDVSSATSKQIMLRKPDGTVLTKTASFTTDGTDGLIRYATVENDLDTEGTWHIQGKVTLPTGTWHTDIQSFKVHGNLGS